MQRNAAVQASATGSEMVFRARMVVDLSRLPLLAFLTEVGRNEEIILIERLALRPAAQPALAEIELRVLGRLRAGSTSSAVEKKPA
jgi:hypothetical protein